MEKLLTRDKVKVILAGIAILALALGVVIAFFVVPGGTTAEEVIQDSIAIKTHAQICMLVGVVSFAVWYKMED